MSNYIASAADIVSAASKLSAGRVCFYRDGYMFCRPVEEDVRGVLKSFGDQRGVKYKLQVVEDGKWRDVAKYRMIFDKDKLIRDVRKYVDSDERPFGADDLVDLHGIDPAALSKILSNVSYDLVMRQHRRIDLLSIQSALNLFLEVHERVQSLDLDYFLAYLDLYGLIVRSGSFGRAMKIESVAHVVNEIDDYVVENERKFVSDGARIAVLNLKGQVLSLSDRSAAAKHFAEVRGLDETGLIRRFYLDMGVNTYYDRHEVECGESSDLLMSVKCGLSIFIPPEAAGEWCILISVDSNFFRIYAPLLFFFAQQLPVYDFHFLLVGDDSEVNGLEKEGRAYAESLASLNKGGASNNVYFSRSHIPEFVQSRKTYYACARFLAVDQYLSRYPNVYVMDADVFLESDPRPFFSKLKDEPVVLPITKGIGALSPWRRHLAGNVALSACNSASIAIERLQLYLARGLMESNSWMLDQNAWTYVSEQSFVGNMNEHARPIVQPKFRSVWESNYWNRIGS